VLVGVLLAVLFGVWAILGIPRQLTPTVERPVIGLTVRYPGAAPQEIEREIVNRIEEQLKAVEGVREMTSQSAENLASISLEFDWGTDLDVASIDVINKLNLVEDLPDDADEPVLFFGQQWEQPISFISLTGENRTPEQLREFAEDVLEAAFKRIPGVSRVAVFGGRERVVEATYDPYDLVAYRLTPLDISNVLAAENENTRGGKIDEEKNRWVVRTVGEFRTDEDVENVILERPGTSDIRLGEFLEVDQFRYKDAEAHVRIDGSRGVVFAVYKKTGENVVEIMKGEGGVYDTVEDLNDELALQKMQLKVAYDESEYIDRSIDQLQTNLIYCVILASAVLVFFLRNVRAILTIVVTIPIAFVATFVFLWAFGRTLNVVSLAGLAFAIGMLVDNAIVVLENIYRHRQMGKSAAEAAFDGAREVWGAVLAATLTTVAVFIPILLIQEEAGQLFSDIALAVAISVSLSLVVSVTVIPMLTARILKTEADRGRQRRSGDEAAPAKSDDENLAFLEEPAEELRGDEGLFEEGEPRGDIQSERVVPGEPGRSWFAYLFLLGWLGDLVKRGIVGLTAWLQRGVIRRLAAAVLILGVFGGALVFFYLKTPPTYLPKGNRNFVLGFVQTEAGASVEHNLQVAKDLERRVLALPGVERFFIVTLADRVFFGARAADAEEARVLSERIQAAIGSRPPPFVPEQFRQAWFDRNAKFLDEPIAGVTMFADQVGLFQRRGTIGGQTIDITVRGDSIEKLYAIGDAVQDGLGRLPGVFFVNPSYQLGKWELQPTVDRHRAADVGLTAREVGFAVGSLVTGFKVADFREADGNELDLVLRGHERYRQHIETLETVPLWTPRGRPALVGQVAPVRPAEGFNVIEHTEQQRSVSLEVALVEGTAIGEITRQIREESVAGLRSDGTIPPDYFVDLRGQARELDRMLAELSGKFLLALVIVYLLMAALFESFAYPLVIMLSVPLAIVGGYMMFYAVLLYNVLVVGIPPPQLDVVTMLGFVIMIGIIVNNAILVVAQALNFHRSEGLEIKEAIVASVESRIRPIFMSTLTSILGMLPLVLIPGPGSELYQGLGAVVVGGLAVSTVFTLILTPVLFSFAFGITERLRALAIRLGIIVSPEEQPAELAGEA
jgi:HAE1 family hydrophobic/amphiphilic exporter-1